MKVKDAIFVIAKNQLTRKQLIKFREICAHYV